MTHPLIDSARNSAPVRAHYPDPAHPSGLRWEPWRPTGAELRRWSLHRRGEMVGWCSRHWSSRTWHASVWRRPHYVPIYHGTLADCARALVEEVRRG